jgi:hypothetical protein
MRLSKLLALGTTSLLGVALTGAMPPSDDPPPPPDAKKKKEAGGPGGDLAHVYSMLRRLRADDRTTGRPEERLKDWTDRAAKLYRKAIEAAADGEDRKAREYGTAAHDIARAVDHARNASTAEPDDNLPPPPDTVGDDERTRRDLTHAHDRIADLRDDKAPETAFYFKAAKDLYNAARRDAEAGRMERAGELARAAEALTHVPEHLARANRDEPEPKEKKAKKEKKDKAEPKEKKEKKDRPEPKEKPDRSDKLPPPID